MTDEAHDARAHGLLPDAGLLARRLAALRIFTGLILFANGVAKLFEFRTIEIGPWKTFLINKEGARNVLDFEVNERGGDGTDVPLLSRRSAYTGRICACGESESPKGFDPATDCRAERLDRDVGKHGDTGEAELTQFARVRAGELDACVISTVATSPCRRDRTLSMSASPRCWRRWTRPTRGCASRWSWSTSISGSTWT